MGFPRVSETFIASELLRVERAGVPVRLFVIKPRRGARARAPPPRRRRDRRRAGPPARPQLADRAAAPLAPRAPAAVRPGDPAHAPPPARRPRPRRRDRARPGAARPPRPARRPAQDLRQGAAPGDRARRPAARRARRPPPARALRPRHDDDHVARRAHHRPAVLLHRPRARHLRARPEPARLAAAQAARRRVRRHVHRRQRRAPAPDRAGGGRPARLPRAQRRLRAAARAARRAARPRTAALRVLGVGRLVAKKGFDVLVDACAVLDRRGVPFEALIVGQDDKHGDAVRDAIRRHGLDDRVRLPGPLGQAELLAEYRRASALCMPCRLLPDDRDGIPNVLVEAMAAGAPVVASAVSGIPELVARRGERADGRARGPGGARRRAAAPAHRPRARRSASPRPDGRPCASGSTATSWPARLAALFARGGRRDEAGRVRDRAPASRPRRRRGGRRRALHPRGRDADARPRARTGSAPTLPADEEWRIEWVKFYYGLDLAHAYRVTGARAVPRGVGAARRVVDPPGAARPRQQRRDRAQDPQLDLRVAGLRRRPRSTRRCAASIAAQARHVRATLTPERNHRTLELYALLLAALAVPGTRRRRRPAPLRARRARPQPGRGLPRRRRPSRGVDALPHGRAALVPRRARERAPLRRRAARGVRGAARARQRVRAPLPPPGRPHPGPLGRGHRQLPRAARAGGRAARPRRRAERRASPTAATSCSAAAGMPARSYARLRLRPARRRRPRPLRPAQRRAVRGRAAAGRRPRAAAPTRRARRTCAAGSAAPRPTTRSASTGSTRRRTRARGRRGRSPQGRFLGRATAPGRDALAGEARSPALRRGAPAPRHARRRRALGDRGPAARRDAAPLRPALPPGAGRARRRARRGRHRPRARRDAADPRAPTRIALEPGWVAPRYGEHLPAPGRQRRRRRRPRRGVRHGGRPAHDAQPATPPSRAATRCSTAPRWRARSAWEPAS